MDIDLPSVDDLISRFDLVPHPEGGFYRESYRSPGTIPASVLSASYEGDRNYCTAIYFLLPAGTKSRFHRIASDEIWHFYLGSPIQLHELLTDGSYRTTILGPDLAGDQTLQHVVPAGTWFAGMPTESSGYSLVGCTVSPGFDFADFDLADQEVLAEKFPQQRDLILRF